MENKKDGGEFHFPIIRYEFVMIDFLSFYFSPSCKQQLLFQMDSRLSFVFVWLLKKQAERGKCWGLSGAEKINRGRKTQVMKGSGKREKKKNI